MIATIVFIVFMFIACAVFRGTAALMDDAFTIVQRHVHVNRASIRVRIGRWDYRLTRRNHRIALRRLNAWIETGFVPD